MQQTYAPAGEELVARAASIVPLLRERSLWIDRNRRLPDDVVQALEDSGVLRMRAPAQYGGYESDARSLVDVHAELARGNGSAAFVVSVYALLNWMAGLWPDEVQDEIFSVPHVRVCGTLAASGTARRVDGGYVISGTWRFNSGFLHSQWKLAGAVIAEKDGSFTPITALVPSAQFAIEDDWHTLGLAGTGSVSVTAEELFVPAVRVIPTADFFGEQCKSPTNRTKGLYEVPMLVTSTAATAGQLVGAAQYALETVLERMPTRGITYTDWAKQAEAPITHLRVGEAALLIEEAQTRARNFADLIDRKAAAGAGWSAQERIVSRVQLGRVAQLARQAVDLLAQVSGGTSLYEDVPVLRIQRDLNAVVIHALTNPDTNIELYGRTLCGQEPNTLYF